MKFGFTLAKKGSNDKVEGWNQLDMVHSEF